ncbi:hypothetical protein TIFTF001_029740 [Ficus carica]|uniref:Uncharacterized protein n=1 Tax=Ficus carica TaxID=3494 RepID=A0AA88DSV8_FICCA|nr:hypothetical protein TIFTF001_029740 [Ficus carica]
MFGAISLDVQFGLPFELLHSKSNGVYCTKRRWQSVLAHLLSNVPCLPPSSPICSLSVASSSGILLPHVTIGEMHDLFFNPINVSISSPPVDSGGTWCPAGNGDHTPGIGTTGGQCDVECGPRSKLEQKVSLPTIFGFENHRTEPLLPALIRLHRPCTPPPTRTRKCLEKQPVSRTYGITPRKNYSLKNLMTTWLQLAGSSQQVAFWSYGPDNKECTHLRYEGLRNKELYCNIFEKNHAAGASGFGSVTMGGGSTPMFKFDFSMDQSGTYPVLEEDISPSIGAQRQANTRGVNDEGGPSQSRGSTGKRKQRDATDEMTYTAMEEIANNFRGRSQSTTSSVQNTSNLDIVDGMNIMKEMSVPQYQRTIMWHYFDAHPRLQRPFCVLDDDDRRGIIASVVTSQMPPPS